MQAIVTEPIYDVAHLAHVELLTPDLDGTLAFFRDLLGMQETVRAGGSVYLRGYEEQYHHSLKLTAAPQAGAGHVAWRSRSVQALERRVAAIEASGLGRGWIDGDLGHGRAFGFETPEGHPMENLLGGRVRDDPGGQGHALRNRPQRRPGSGVPVRRIDHLNLMVADTAALPRLPGRRARLPRARTGDGRPRHGGRELAERHQPLARHSAGAGADAGPRPLPPCLLCTITSLQHLFDLAELAREAGIGFETGPGRHGIGGAAFLYLFEPGGNRIELMGDPGYMIFDPLGGPWSGTHPRSPPPSPGPARRCPTASGSTARPPSRRPTQPLPPEPDKDRSTAEIISPEARRFHDGREIPVRPRI